MIYLGFDHYLGKNIVNYRGQKLICHSGTRTVEIMDGLYDVSIRVLGVLPYTHKVAYSHHAWSDLLSVAQ
ncbi:MAG: hypothetical protein V3V68_05055 [Nitrosomonadaceae bacterium]